MINPVNRLSDNVKLYVDGKEVGAVQSISLERSADKVQETSFKPLSIPTVGTIKVERVKVNPEVRKWLRAFSGFDIAVKNVVTRPGAKKLRSKKKRLLKKWKKRNIIMSRETVYENCIITNYLGEK